MIGRLRRRTTTPIDVPGADGMVTVPAGEFVDIVLGVANVDPQAVGAQPLAVCPSRPVADEATSTGLSFGDGPHKCPGAHIAILETDIFLSRLFALEGVLMQAPPRVTSGDEIGGYELRGLIIALPERPI